MSDWSSDVCSSDLEVSGDGLGALAIGEFAEDAADDGCLGLIDLTFPTARFAIAVEALDHVIAIAKPTACLAQIGRVSCRASVCPSVSIPVVSVSLKKQQQTLVNMHTNHTKK